MLAWLLSIVASNAEHLIAIGLLKDLDLFIRDARMGVCVSRAYVLNYLASDVDII